MVTTVRNRPIRVSSKNRTSLNDRSAKKRSKDKGRQDRIEQSKKHKPKRNTQTMNDTGSTVISNRTYHEDDAGYESSISAGEENNNEKIQEILMAFEKRMADNTNKVMTEIRNEMKNEMKEEFLRMKEEFTERPPMKTIDKCTHGNYSSLSDGTIFKGLQKSMNHGLRTYIRDKTYDSLKFIHHDKMAHIMIKEAVHENYIQMPNGWTYNEFESHMTQRVYKAYGVIRQNNMSQARKKFLGEN